jgi:hypothetical protein
VCVCVCVCVCGSQCRDENEGVVLVFLATRIDIQKRPGFVSVRPKCK